MRLAVLSDIHANRPALEAALAAADRAGADAVVCPGDLVGYGPHPDDCVRLVQSASALTVAGNHDLIVVGRLGTDRCIPLARRSLEWTRAVIGGEARAALEALPLEGAPAPGVLMTHGAPGDPEAYVHGPEQARTALAAAAAGDPGVRLVLVGHTHRWMAYGERRGSLPTTPDRPVELDAAERVLLNPGSVGQSRERAARARFMVLDLAAGSVTFRAVAYDVRATRRALRREGLPPRSVHLRPSRARRLAAEILAPMRRRRP